MRRQIIYLSAVSLGVLFLATGILAQTTAPMKATAPEKMMPSDRATKMRACEKRAKQQKIKMEDRTSFVSNCMADKAQSN
jgi:psiF repeat